MIRPLNAVADHQPRELAGAEKIAHQIDPQRAVEIPQREVANKRRRLGDPGAVYQQVDARKNLIHPVGQGGDAGLAGRRRRRSRTPYLRHIQR